ncbi:uncharacterized protein TRIADDRAFT_57057 [Trichoplax adhaerens]|uniref:TGF-beta family profile domain-containing protein n=1 Tax=Trichoplax adhaerens TaxID=10228 RepID=B3S0I2_TRIAD|nr:hypothetical protein TRIADDRAFT_57057 [Trichoplax adhaerens]EDV23647.1 hypothetical protein TRIADDRAFT_57057 [Trichoplax adhaerens]|eukprot:XP_002113173.1 hypothetical protein TRIADDRAFT_57057 [Trichoplax adhaerens]
MTKSNRIFKCIIYVVLLSHSLNWQLVTGFPKPPVDNMMISSWNRRLSEDNHYHGDSDEEFSKRLESQLLYHIERQDRRQHRQKVPQLMHDLYHIRAEQHQQQMSQEEEENYLPIQHNYMDIPFVSKMAINSVVRNFHHQGELNDKGIVNDNILYFDLSSENPDEEILDQAILRIHYHGQSPHDNAFGASIVRVYIVTTHQSRMDYKLINEEKLASNASKWISIDVTQAVKNWLTKSHPNLGLKVEVVNLHSVPSKSNRQLPSELVNNNRKSNHRLRLRRGLNHLENQDQWNQQRPILLIHSHDKTIVHQRRKRATTSTTTSTKSKKGCKRHKLKVNFAAVGWNDWIIAPKDYDAYLCKGRCKFPLSQHMNATNHAIIQTVANQHSPDEVPLPCCVPTELDPIPLLYINARGKSVLKSYRDMVVRQCGCR